MVQRPDDEGRLFQAQFDYAWKWFKYHAGQRLTAFNFFLVLAGASLIAYGGAVKEHADAFGIGIGSFASLVAFAFLFLDFRNKKLVDAGGQVLDQLEEALGVRIRDRQQPPWWSPTTHSFWLRVLLLAFCVIGALGTAWAAADFGRDDPPRAVRQSH